MSDKESTREDISSQLGDKEEKSTRELRLSVRVTEEEMTRIDALRAKIEARTKGHFRVTYKTVLLEAIEALEARYKDAERKR
jgi:hypothetical protein